MTTDGGGWTLCTSVTSRESAGSPVNNVPNSGDWRTDVYTTGYGTTYTSTTPTTLQPGYIDNTKGGSIGCANVVDSGEIMVLSHYSDNATKGVIGNLPSNWETGTDVSINGTKYKKAVVDGHLHLPTTFATTLKAGSTTSITQQAQLVPIATTQAPAGRLG